MKSKPPFSAFEQGQIAGKAIDPGAPNPFTEGSAEHNNFEVGRRFGEKNHGSRDRFRDMSHSVGAGEAS